MVEESCSDSSVLISVTVAHRYLPIPTTSALIERLFSVTGQVVTETRSRLQPETVTLLVFLHEALPVHHKINFQRFLGTMKMDEVVEIPGDSNMCLFFGFGFAASVTPDRNFG